MNFADEEYVRLYVADTVTWKCLEWQGQALLALALRKFDRSGLLEFGRHGAEKALMVATGMPLEFVRVGLQRLLDEEVWVLRDDCIFWPKYIEAQTCTRSDRVRQRTSRARRASERDDASRIVTSGHDSESDVTNVTDCHPRPGEARQGKDLDQGSPEGGDPANPKLTPAQRQELSLAEPISEARSLFDAWQTESGKTGAKYDFSAREFFEGILRDGVTPDVVTRVTRGAKLDDYARNTGRLAFRLLLKDSAQREKYLEIERSPPAPAKPKHNPPQPNNTANPYPLRVQ